MTTEVQEATKSYRFHHTMLRVKDPVKSRAFYENGLGMKLLGKFDYEQAKFTLYFYGYCDEHVAEQPMDSIFDKRIPMVELTHNWGTENQPDFSYANGNKEEKRGFGHIAITVDDVYAASERLEKLGYNVRRKPGPMMGTVHIAFVEDPDEYWVELIQVPK